MAYQINGRVDVLDTAVVQAYQQITTGTIGHRIEDGALDSGIQQIAGRGLVAGPAVTVRVSGRDSTVCHKVFDLVAPGDVLVIDGGRDTKYACWGEMMTLAARTQEVAAVIVDGPITDVVALRDIGLPVFARAASPITTLLLGQGGEINTTIDCGGVRVAPGDLVVADEDGVIAVRAEIAAAVLPEFIAEANADDEYRTQLLAGARPSELAPIDELIGRATAISKG